MIILRKWQIDQTEMDKMAWKSASMMISSS